jgi:hypothetical protein
MVVEDRVAAKVDGGGAVRSCGVVDMGAVSWIEAEPAGGGSDDAPLAESQVAQWRTAGAVVVDQLLPIELILEARRQAVDTFIAAAARGPVDFGSGGTFVFPSDCTELNEISLHPRLLAAVAQLLGCPVRDLRLSQSDLWAKHGKAKPVDDPYDNTDQRMHVDYPNHTLLHPPAWDEPDAVEMIIYADTVEECGGATAVVLRDGPDDPAYPWPIVGTPGVGPYPWVNDRGRAEELVASMSPEVAAWRQDLYDRERRVRYRPGTVLLYRHDTWHRGTPIDPGAVRVVQNLTFRKASSEWISTLHEGWAWAMYRRSQVMERLIAEASIDQRCVLGFPPPGHPWWTPDTVAAVEARYSAFQLDLSAYLPNGS